MMGKDMFAQERMNLNDTISALKVECHEQLDTIERGVKYQRELINAKKAQSEEIRFLKTENHDLSQKVAKMTNVVKTSVQELSLIQNSSHEHKVMIDKLNNEIIAINNKNRNLQEKLALKDESLTQKRMKKRNYKKQVEEANITEDKLR